MALMDPEGGFDKQKHLPPTVLEYFRNGDILTDISGIQSLERSNGRDADMGLAFAKKLTRVGREYLQAAGTKDLEDINKKMALSAILFGVSFQVLYDHLHTDSEGVFGYYNFDNRPLFSLFDISISGTLVRGSEDLLDMHPEAKFPTQAIPKNQWIDYKVIKNVHGTDGIAKLFEKWRWSNLPQSIQFLALGLKIEDNVRDVAKLFEQSLQQLKETLDAHLNAHSASLSQEESDGVRRLLASVDLNPTPMDDATPSSLTQRQEESVRRLLDW